MDKQIANLQTMESLINSMLRYDTMLEEEEEEYIPDLGYTFDEDSQEINF